jgi:predicted nucleotidyltransferase
VPTLRNGLNFTLTTSLGDLDLLGEVVGGGNYGALLAHTFDVEAFGVKFKCVDLPTLIKLKRAAGRPKDLESLAELEVLLKDQRGKR